MKLAIKGSRVSARAGIIGSGNILVTKTTETICPKANTIAMYMKETKCSSLIKLKIPQKLYVVKVAPLQKNETIERWNTLKQFIKNMERKGGK